MWYIILAFSVTRKNARVVELVDSLDSGSSAHSGHAGSSPASRTKVLLDFQQDFFLCHF